MQDRENSWSCPNSAIRRELSCSKLDPQTAISPRRPLFDEAWSDEIPPTQSGSEDLAGGRRVAHPKRYRSRWYYQQSGCPILRVFCEGNSAISKIRPSSSMTA